jgi:hypothetical protein
MKYHAAIKKYVEIHLTVMILLNEKVIKQHVQFDPI